MTKCPDCGADLRVERNHLTTTEYTTVFDCENCGFGLETESNLVGYGTGSST